MIKKLIPCLDFYNGRVVKGKNFNNLVDIGDPVDLSRFYNDEGADELVILDINATLENKNIIYKFIYNISSKLFIPLTVGGGINNLEKIKNLFNSGADKISINSFIINNLSFIKKINKIYGSQCLIAAIDSKEDLFKNFKFFNFHINSGKLIIKKNLIDLILKYLKFNVGEFLLTSIDNDGTKLGYNKTLIKNITNIIDKSLIISGGFTNLINLINILKISEIEGILIASNLHNLKYRLFNIKKFLFNNGIFIRSC